MLICITVSNFKSSSNGNTHNLHLQTKLEGYLTFKQIYDKIRIIFTIDWYGNSENISTLKTFTAHYPSWEKKILNLIEPTAMILQIFLLYLYTEYRSITASNFLRDLTDNIVKISNGEKNDWYPELPDVLVYW